VNNFDEVNDFLMNPANWVVGGIDAIRRYMNTTIEVAVTPRLVAASDQYSRQQAQGVPDEYLDVDAVIDESEFGRWVEICFFLGIFAFWESHVAELSEAVKPLSSHETQVGRRTQVAIDILRRELDTPATDPSLADIKSVRERLAHDGGQLTPRGKSDLSALLKAGRLRQMNWEDLGFDDTFVNDAAEVLGQVYRSWSDQLRSRGLGEPTPG